MSLRVVFQADPIEKLTPGQDTTFALMAEAFRRGHKVFVYTPDQLVVQCHEGQETPKLKARGFDLQFRGDDTLGDVREAVCDLGDADMIWIRQNPPFDMGYMAYTYALESLQPRTLVLNSPQGLRDFSEKMGPLMHCSALMPPSLVTRSVSEIMTFWRTHPTIVLKSLWGFGGTDVWRIGPQDEGKISEILGLVLTHPGPVMVQKYLPEVVEGDTRILLCAGDSVGSFRRIPPQEGFLANLVAGGQAVAAALTPEQHRVCERLKPLLKEKGLFFVGLDMIGGYVTELNTTSPTGVWSCRKLYGTRPERDIWEKAEYAYATRC